MTRYEWIFFLCVGATLLFIINANFQNILWEFGYFYDGRIAWLIVGYLMIERAKNSYEKEIAKLLKYFFYSLIVWEIIASISWDFANSGIILGALFCEIIFLIRRLFWEVHKRSKNECSHS